MKFRFLPRPMPSVLIGALAMIFATGLPAYVNDAYSYAMEEAVPEAKKDVYIREDFWGGEIRSGQTHNVKAQLFRGNLYCFWVGTVPQDVTISVQVLDPAGQPIETTETRLKQGRAAFQIAPNRTGAFTIRLTMTSASERTIEWALAYGYF